MSQLNLLQIVILWVKCFQYIAHLRAYMILTRLLYAKNGIVDLHPVPSVK